MKKSLLIFFTLLVTGTCIAQCAVNCVGTYRVRKCGADTTMMCVATMQQINPTKIVIRNFVCAYNYFNAYDTIIADLDCVNDSLHLEYVSYTDNNAPLSFWGRGIMTQDSIKIICGQMSRQAHNMFVMYMIIKLRV